MHIYVIGQMDGAGPLKFGYSRSNVASRLKSIQTGYPYKLHVVHVEDLAEVATITSYEAAIFGLLGEWRLRGEWFSRTPDTLSFISLWVKFGLAAAIRMFPERFVQRRQEARAIARKAKRRRARKEAEMMAGTPRKSG